MASVFISRWDVAVMDRVPPTLDNQLGIAMAGRIYKAYINLLNTPRWLRPYNAGARPQRLLWASTGTKHPTESDNLYVKELASAFTVNTIPEATLKSFGEHGEIGPILPTDGGDCERVFERLNETGVNLESLAARLQDEGAHSFVKSWEELLSVIATKSAALTQGA